MSEKSLTIALSKVLCRAARHSGWCSHCENGPCDPIMHQTFESEARAVIGYLLENGILKRSRLL